MSNVIVNGEFCDHISIMDRGLHYGDGVFETIRVKNGRPALWNEHMRRLCDGCVRLSIPPAPPELLRRETQTAIDGFDNAAVKIIVTRGQGGRGYRMPDNAAVSRIVIRYPYPHYPEENYRQGVRVRLCSTRLAANPVLAGIKHLNRLENVLARSEWRDDTVAEGLMLDQTGRIIEGMMTNVFVVKHGELITPDLSQCGVAGVMRDYVLQLAQELQIGHDIMEVDQNHLKNADEVFLTNSLIGIWPVRQWEQIRYPAGAVTRRLMAELSGREV